MPFVVADDGELTYGDLDRATATTAAHLARDGIVKGTRVGIVMPNSVAWVLAGMAASRIGAVLVPLTTRLRPSELEAQLRAAAVERLFVAGTSPALTPGARPRFDPTLPRLRSVDVWDEWLASSADGRAAATTVVDALEHAVRPADDLAIIFTSGSGGAPKGVIHTHGGALAATAAGLDARCLTRDDRLDSPMPFSGIGGFGTGLLSVLVAGATLVTEAQPEPSRKPARASFLGMTETFGPYCGERLDRELPPRSKEGSCGRPFPGVELRVVAPDTGAVVGTGTVGEIQVRSRNLMRGICGRLRAETFTVDGFLPTGDLGVVDDDGYVFFRGRLGSGT
jgi:acyl-CoA synthetase (AMP-forming)/AMP-acid ligase II